MTTGASPTANTTETGEEPVAKQRPPFASAAVLVAIAFLHHLDRTVMSGLLEPIKQTFEISDFAVGALSGVGFGLAYAALGLPFARYADVANRKWLLTISLVLWSGLTALCGLATSAWTFFAARVGVGISEAAGAPAMHALIADQFPPSRRSGAASVLVLGMTFGAIVGITGGGIAADHFGWRVAFVAAGIPGLILAPLAILYLRENRPPRPQPDIRTIFGAEMAKSWLALLRLPSFRFLVAGAVVNGLWMWGTATWFTTFLIRSHGLSLSEAALGYGLLSGGSTVIGVALGGLFGDRFAARDIRWLVWLPALAAIGTFVFVVPVYLVSSVWLVLVLYALASVFTGLISPLQFGAVYALTGSARRATGVALINFAIYLVGLGVAPAAVGAISDLLALSEGADSLSYSLLVLTAVLPLAALSYFLAGRNFTSHVASD